MKEVRTKNGKLVGTVDSWSNMLHIKDGKKTTMIEIPDSGLLIQFNSGSGVIEEVRINSHKNINRNNNPAA